MSAAVRVLWAALVSLYDETVTLVLGNLGWVVLNLPWLLLFTLLVVPFAGSLIQDGAGFLFVGLGWLLVILPTPGAVALGGLAEVAAGPDAPRIGRFWQTLRAHWRLASACTLLSTVVAAALVGNLVFYALAGVGWLRLTTVLWLYATLFWLSLHVYLVPLMLHVAEPRLLDLYRRAAVIALGHPLYTGLLVLVILLAGLVSVVFLPAYVLIAGAYVAMVQAHAFREVRRRHGDLVVEPEEEGRL